MALSASPPSRTAKTLASERSQFKAHQARQIRALIGRNKTTNTPGEGLDGGEASLASNVAPANPSKVARVITARRTLNWRSARNDRPFADSGDATFSRYCAASASEIRGKKSC